MAEQSLVDRLLKGDKESISKIRAMLREDNPEMLQHLEKVAPEVIRFDELDEGNPVKQSSSPERFVEGITGTTEDIDMLKRLLGRGGDEEAVAQRAFSEDQFEDPIGVGTEPASPEEQKMYNAVMDGIESMIHGKYRDDILQGLAATPELWLNVASVSQQVIEGAHMKMREQGVEPQPDMFFGENGIIQSTVELIWELADAAAIPGSEDDQQLDTAYMKVLQSIGEELYETDDVAVSEAQQLLLDSEFGGPISDVAAEEFQRGEAMQNMMPQGPPMLEEQAPMPQQIPGPGGNNGY